MYLYIRREHFKVDVGLGTFRFDELLFKDEILKVLERMCFTTTVYITVCVAVCAAVCAAVCVAECVAVSVAVSVAVCVYQ